MSIIPTLAYFVTIWVKLRIALGVAMVRLFQIDPRGAGRALRGQRTITGRAIRITGY